MKLKERARSKGASARESSAFRGLGVINEVQSSIPSRMKHFSTLDVKMDGSLRVKRCIVLPQASKKVPTLMRSQRKNKSLLPLISSSMSEMTQT